MLEKLHDQFRECHEYAAEAKANAKAATDAALKADFLAAERRWLALARSLGFSERLEDSTTKNSTFVAIVVSAGSGHEAVEPTVCRARRCRR
jgi:hypothetical protein